MQENATAHTKHFLVPVLEEVFDEWLVVPTGHPAVFIRLSKQFVIHPSNTTFFFVFLKKDFMFRSTQPIIKPHYKNFQNKVQYSAVMIYKMGSLKC
jgi:hypothetical protein